MKRGIGMSYIKGNPSNFEEMKNNPEILKTIDLGVLPIIKLCIEKGIPTEASCEGHAEKNENGYIRFSTLHRNEIRRIINAFSVSEENIFSYDNHNTASNDLRVGIHWLPRNKETSISKIVGILSRENIASTPSPLYIKEIEKMLMNLRELGVDGSIFRYASKENASKGFMTIKNGSFKIHNEIIGIVDGNKFSSRIDQDSTIISWNDEIISNELFNKGISQINKLLESHKNERGR
jgi:hypothetical protein